MIERYGRSTLITGRWESLCRLQPVTPSRHEGRFRSGAQQTYRAPKSVMLCRICYAVSVILGPGMKPTKRREFIALVGGAATWPFGVIPGRETMPIDCPEEVTT
jgi:hypothetical protein